MKNVKNQALYELNVSGIGKYYSLEMMHESLVCLLYSLFENLHEYAVKSFQDKCAISEYERDYDYYRHQIIGVMNLAESLGLFDGSEYHVYQRYLKNEYYVLKSGKAKYDYDWCHHMSD